MTNVHGEASAQASGVSCVGETLFLALSGAPIPATIDGERRLLWTCGCASDVPIGRRYVEWFACAEHTTIAGALAKPPDARACALLS